MNADGNIWIANAVSNECVLFAPGGEVLDVVNTSQNCYACMLGGDDGKTLFMLTAQSSQARIVSVNRTGKIEINKVELVNDDEIHISGNISYHMINNSSGNKTLIEGPFKFKF